MTIDLFTAERFYHDPKMRIIIDHYMGSNNAAEIQKIGDIDICLKKMPFHLKKELTLWNWFCHKVALLVVPNYQKRFLQAAAMIQQFEKIMFQELNELEEGVVHLKHNLLENERKRLIEVRVLIGLQERYVERIAQKANRSAIANLLFPDKAIQKLEKWINESKDQLKLKDLKNLNDQLKESPTIQQKKADLKPRISSLKSIINDLGVINLSLPVRMNLLRMDAQRLKLLD